MDIGQRWIMKTVCQRVNVIHMKTELEFTQHKASQWAEFNTSLDTLYYFRNNSFQAIDCTGTDIQTYSSSSRVGFNVPPNTDSSVNIPLPPDQHHCSDEAKWRLGDQYEANKPHNNQIIYTHKKNKTKITNAMANKLLRVKKKQKTKTKKRSLHQKVLPSYLQQMFI